MILELYNEINHYIGDTLDILAGNEIQNNIMIGNCLKAQSGMNISKWFLAAVKDNTGSVRLTAMMTPAAVCLLTWVTRFQTAYI